MQNGKSMERNPTIDWGKNEKLRIWFRYVTTESPRAPAAIIIIIIIIAYYILESPTIITIPASALLWPSAPASSVIINIVIN